MSSNRSSSSSSSSSDSSIECYTNFRVMSHNPPAGEGNTMYQVECDKISSTNGRSHGTEEAENLGPAYSSQSLAYAMMCKIQEANLRDPSMNPKTFDHANGLTEVIPILYDIDLLISHRLTLTLSICVYIFLDHERSASCSYKDSTRYDTTCANSGTVSIIFFFCYESQCDSCRSSTSKRGCSIRQRR